MKKKLLIISTLFVLISGVLFVWMQIRTLKQNGGVSNEDSSDQGALFNGSNYNNGPLFTEEALNIQNKVKGDIQNKTIPTAPYFSTDIQIVDVYPEGLGASQIPYYQTEYYPQENQFRILLFKFPLQETRLRAERYLLQKLGINEQQACMLKISVEVTPGASESLAWKNLGLSFCLGSTDLSSYNENIDGVSNADQEQPSDTVL